MKFIFHSNIDRNTVFNTLEKTLLEKDFTITKRDEERPWGGFFVIDENQSEKFITQFFSSPSSHNLVTGNKLSPKILIVEPGKKLSWQYHFRRAEVWKVISGEVGIVRSETDRETDLEKYKTGSIVELKKGERHRLIGLDTWGVIAEIWQHTDNNHPSDEDDIVRLQDDFGR